MKKIFGWLFIIIINYFLFLFLIYILSAILLTKKIIPNFGLITEYQRNYYTIGLRNIWHSNEECVEFSESQVYIPKKTNCDFNNIEFETTLSFNELGRYSDHPEESNYGVVVLGDSHAMGWGVNDEETFSHLLEKKINKPVYNLGVSGYGTIRQLIRLKESNLLNKVDTIIIQYCYNDHGENVNYEKNSLDAAKKKYELVTGNTKYSFWKKLRKSFRYAATIPIDIITNKNKKMDFNHHNETFIKVLKSYPFVKDKRIIVFYVNGHQQIFTNFPKGKSKIFNNLEYVDLNIEKNPKNFYLIDGHLNQVGHIQIADKLSRLF